MESDYAENFAFAKQSREDHPPSCSPRGILLSANTLESNYLRVTAPAPLALRDYEHPDLAPLLLAIESFCMLEGPFWRKIRGKGLSYSYHLAFVRESGMMSFGLFKATNPALAMEEAAKIFLAGVEEEEDGSPTEQGDGSPGKRKREEPSSQQSERTKALQYEQHLSDPTNLDAARSGLAYALINGVSTIPAVLQASISDTLSRRGKDRVQKFLKKLMAVTAEDAIRCTREYICPLFEKENSTSPRVFSLSCPENKKDDVAKALREKLGWRVTEMSVTDMEEKFATCEGYARVRGEVL